MGGAEIEAMVGAIVVIVVMEDMEDIMIEDTATVTATDIATEGTIEVAVMMDTVADMEVTIVKTKCCIFNA